MVAPGGTNYDAQSIKVAENLTSRRAVLNFLGAGDPVCASYFLSLVLRLAEGTSSAVSNADTGRCFRVDSHYTA